MGALVPLIAEVTRTSTDKLIILEEGDNMSAPSFYVCSPTIITAGESMQKVTGEYQFFMKSTVFWNVAPCGCIINRRFGGT
jgi:hypothetical protein